MQVLAGDVGGTYTRLAIIDEHYQVHHHQKYTNREQISVYSIIHDYLKTINVAVDAACLCVAGPVTNDSATLTNLQWHINTTDLARVTHTKAVAVINDFAAIGSSIAVLQKTDLLTVHAALHPQLGNRLVVGVGTGFGSSYLVQRNGKFEVFDSEAGHMDFAPNDEFEVALLQYLLKKYPHVSVERVLSGVGVENLFEFVLKTQSLSSSLTLETFNDCIVPGKKVFVAALEEQDEAALFCVRRMARLCGSVFGSLALAFLPYGGIYVGGGVSRRIKQLLLENDNFLTAFKTKGRMSRLMHNMPIHFIVTENAGIIGAAHYVRSRFASVTQIKKQTVEMKKLPA